MRIIIKAILKTILKLLVILIPTIYFLVATQLGLKFDLKLARLFLPGKLEVTHVKGALLNTFDLEKLNYHDQSITISMKNLSFSWSLLKSLYSKITIEKIKIDDLNIKLAKQPSNKNKPNTHAPIKLETYLKPLQSLKFTIKDISINNLHIQYEKSKVAFHNTQLISESTGDKFYLNKFITKANSIIISSTGTIDYNKKFQSQLLITTSGPISSTTKLKGDLNNYQLNTDVFSPFKLYLTGKINNNLTFNTSLVSNYLYWPIKSKEIIATHSKFVISGTPKHVNLKGDAKIEINKQKPLPFSIMAAVYYWLPKWCGNMYDERLGRLHFWLSFIGVNVTFFPQHFIGLAGMPRRIPDYALQFADWNMVSTVGAFLFGASQILFLFIVVRTVMGGKKATPEVWEGAQGLEWTVDSPPPYHTFSTPPEVK